MSSSQPPPWPESSVPPPLSEGATNAQAPEHLPLRNGFWISDAGDYLYIPSGNEKAPLIALHRYYTNMVFDDPETNEWVQENFPRYRNGRDGWEFWNVYATYLVLRNWHLLWEGSIVTRWNPEEIASLIRCLDEVKKDLEWPDRSMTRYRQVEKESGDELTFEWGYFSNTANPLPFDQSGE